MSTLHIVETSREGLGRWLRHARKARGLTLSAVAAETKIPRAHLDALERGEPSRLPAFYQRAELRAVARAVGLDEQHAVSRLEAFLPRVEPPIPFPAEPPPRVRSEYVLLAGSAVLAAWMLGWGPFTRSEQTFVAPRPLQAADSASTGDAVRLVQPDPIHAEPAQSQPVQPQPLQRLQPVEAAAHAVPQPADIPQGTELIIRTQPEGAHVTVNGIGWGVSPVTIRHIEPGDKRVRLTLDGYQAVERSVAIDEGARQAVSVRLMEFSGQ